MQKIWGEMHPRLKNHNSGPTEQIPKFKCFTEEGTANKPSKFCKIVQRIAPGEAFIFQNSIKSSLWGLMPHLCTNGVKFVDEIWQNWGKLAWRTSPDNNIYKTIE